MIGWLKGIVMDNQTPGKLVLDVNGVGYDVETSLQTFFKIDPKQSSQGLHIHTVVREDALLLYGFIDKLERALFRELIKVNGIGPKAAMNILSGINTMEFIQCIEQQNSLQLTRIPGIGKKTAERLVIEMRDSVKRLFGEESLTIDVNPISSDLNVQNEAVSALEALGYKAQEALKVIRKIDDGNKTCEQLIRQALQVLSK